LSLPQGIRIKETLLRHLEEAIKNGARNILITNPDGFVFISHGDVDSIDLSIAASLTTMFHRTLDYLNKDFCQKLSKLLKRKTSINEINLSQFVLSFDNRLYIAIFAEGYSLLSSIPSHEKIKEISDNLLKAMVNVIDVFRELKKRIPIKPREEIIEAAPEKKKEIRPVKIELPMEKKINVKKFKDIKFAYQQIHNATITAINTIDTKGDWLSAYRQFQFIHSNVQALIKAHPELADNNVIKAINSWIMKTMKRIYTLLSQYGNSPIDEKRKEILKRGLTQLLNYLRRELYRMMK